MSSHKYRAQRPEPKASALRDGIDSMHIIPMLNASWIDGGLLMSLEGKVDIESGILNEGGGSKSVSLHPRSDSCL